MLVLTLYGRRDCPLCDEMKAAIAEATESLPHRLEEVDVSGDPELERRYGWDVPVLLVNGREACRHRVRAGELRRWLREAEG